ncbi:MAG: extracellular solute-binding protein [Leptolyngbyaceae cyanobacterium SL_1_1]|nr:extracellular solute-binding protein [Leptolyngbyaceae cyanobacterium RM1_1_2]NJO08348.1 extracellular solute-binding protein [Leptolyngbyaceae cyanobacterium SL_1_1]
MQLRQIVQKKNAVWLLLGLLLVQISSLLMLGLTWPSQSSAVTFSLLVPQDELSYWQSLTESFDRQNADIQIKLAEGAYSPSQIQTIYSADLQSDRPQYDLIYMNLVWLPEFASHGWLSDLTPQIDSEALSEFLGSEVEMGRYQKRLYRLPFRASIGVMLVNQLLAGSSVPATFAALFDISRALQQQGQWGYLWQGQEDESLIANFVEVLDGYGGFWIDPATQSVGLDQPEAIQAVQFLRETLVQGISPPTVIGDDAQDSFIQFQRGNTAFLRTWSQFWQRANAASAPLHNQVRLATTLALPGRVRRACRGGWGFAIAKKQVI